MKFRHFTTLHTDFDIEACRRRLTESIDPERRTIFSFSGFKGSKPLIGWIDSDKFFLHKRRYYRNDFAPRFFGNLKRNGRGTVIEGYFDMSRWAKLFMRIWLGLVILWGMPVFALTIWDFVRGTHYVQGDLLVGLLVPPTMVLFGVLLPKFGLWLGRYEEKYILNFLQTTLIASPPRAEGDG